MDYSAEGREIAKQRTETEHHKEIDAVARIFDVDSYDMVTKTGRGRFGGHNNDMNSIHIQLPYNSIQDGYGLYSKKRLFRKPTSELIYCYRKGDILLTVNDTTTEVTVYNTNNDTIIEQRKTGKTVNIRKEMERVLKKLRKKLLI